MFERVGEIVVELAGKDEDGLLEVALEAGAEDVETADDTATIYTNANDLESVRAAVIDAGYNVASAAIIMKPANTITIDDVETAQKLIKLIDALEDNDDVREVYANYDISDEIMEQLD